MTYAQNLADSAQTLPAGIGGAGLMFRNRLINGDMRIDQRNAGAAVNGNGGNKTHPVDRFYSQVYNTTGNTTGQQSSTAPSGFANSMKISVQTADASVGATDQVWYGQDIEGFNVSDFGFGASGAATITLSFWVYSNVTGTYCVTFKNSAQNRGYTAEYTISASNTWEKKTITLAGDTTGTWLTTNGTGLSVWFVLMAGSSQQTTANTWNAGSGTIATSNQVNFMSSTSNAWYITGIQLETGSTATPFEREIYSQTLAKCQRYYQSYGGYTSLSWATPQLSGSSGSTAYIPFPVIMRATPALTVVGTGFSAQDNSLGPSTATISLNTASPFGAYLTYSHSTLTNNATRRLYFTDTTSYLQFAAEL